jgi:hypothetical protein
MSVQALSWVLENAHARLGARLVLIALANHAHDDGSNAFISQQTIAREAHLTDRQVRRCLKELEASGEIVRTDRKADGSTAGRNVRRTNCPRTSTTARPDKSCRKRARNVRQTVKNQKNRQGARASARHHQVR